MKSGLHKTYLLLNDPEIRTLHTRPDLIGFPEEALRAALKPAPRNSASPAPFVLANPPRSETRLQRVESLVVCAMMAALCKAPRSIIPERMSLTRVRLADRFQEAGLPLLNDLPAKDAQAIGYTAGTIAGEAMWPFFSPNAKNPVSPITATLACNIWLEDRLFAERLQPDGTIRPDLPLDGASIFREGTPFEATWADFNDLVLSLPDCPLHDEESAARIRRTAIKQIGPMHQRFQSRGVFLSKEIPE